jgi:glycosyltransferase involved in cell wall biosynthesis
LPLKLLIVGGGSLADPLKKLTESLAISKDTVFMGKVLYEDVSKYQNMLTISVSLSNAESFGVAIIEASACEKPVIVSAVGGLIEVVQDGVTGIVVPPRNPEAAAAAIIALINNPALMHEMGKNGRKRVELLYKWEDNVKQMVIIYQIMLSNL